MELGAFSVSLAVKDIAASQRFYETLGFTPFHGDAAQNWLIMKSGNTVIGLFQGMFATNILTFNPGWDNSAQNADPFTDVRDIQKHLRSAGIQPITEADENSTGPAHFTVVDPDGNVLLFDQHR
jgi:catechol 2,3-dioxygenase-like lactoylglutathione lyase family enzyme